MSIPAATVQFKNGTRTSPRKRFRPSAENPVVNQPNVSVLHVVPSGHLEPSQRGHQETRRPTHQTPEQTRLLRSPNEDPSQQKTASWHQYGYAEAHVSNGSAGHFSGETSPASRGSFAGSESKEKEVASGSKFDCGEVQVGRSDSNGTGDRCIEEILKSLNDTDGKADRDQTGDQAGSSSRDESEETTIQLNKQASSESDFLKIADFEDIFPAIGPEFCIDDFAPDKIFESSERTNLSGPSNPPAPREIMFNLPEGNSNSLLNEQRVSEHSERRGRDFKAGSFVQEESDYLQAAKFPIVVAPAGFRGEVGTVAVRSPKSSHRESASEQLRQVAYRSVEAGGRHVNGPASGPVINGHHSHQQTLVVQKSPKLEQISYNLFDNNNSTISNSSSTSSFSSQNHITPHFATTSQDDFQGGYYQGEVQNTNAITNNTKLPRSSSNSPIYHLVDSSHCHFMEENGNGGFTLQSSSNDSGHDDEYSLVPIEH